ncbi:hypothetical protein PR202_ga15148 [Eleusine coracana subsp. coracana]|uniref:Uncharacterized protein n=1 Tax=Eleusine coracana subsp. coracana TaxID=191504 RepID=A0AAV5CIL1_ELECO|nr:hypothetical protein PR202_ga15148 [Eleusine coracana subsp. coracana]
MVTQRPEKRRPVEELEETRPYLLVPAPIQYTYLLTDTKPEGVSLPNLFRIRDESGNKASECYTGGQWHRNMEWTAGGCESGGNGAEDEDSEDGGARYSSDASMMAFEETSSLSGHIQAAT